MLGVWRPVQPRIQLSAYDLTFEIFNTQNSLFYNDLTPMTDSTKAALCWIDGCFLPFFFIQQAGVGGKWLS
jgi:hypothetical protein